MKVPYAKPSLTIQQQLDLLQNRGITIEDRAAAARFLTFHNYYYLSGYVYYFEKSAPVRTHELSRSVAFSDLIRLARFDRDLRVKQKPLPMEMDL